MDDDGIRQLLRQGARAPRRRVDPAWIRRRARRRRLPAVAGITTLALVLVAAVIMALPPAGELVVLTQPDPASAGDESGVEPPSAIGALEEDRPPEPAVPPSPQPVLEPVPLDPVTTTTAAPSTSRATVDYGADYGAPLWGRRFVVFAVTENGQARPLTSDRPWTTYFSYRPGGEPERQVGWGWGGCNGKGAPIEVTPDRLLLDGMHSTAGGCDAEGSAEERWSERFFASNPYWRLEGERLWLWSGDTIVELQEDTTPPESHDCGEGACEVEQEPE